MVGGGVVGTSIAYHLATMGQREVVLLDSPSTPLCRPDCAGLCPTCGTNLNEGSCDCAPPPADPRWAGLAGLTGLNAELPSE